MNTNPSSHSILSIGNNEIREAVLGNWRESEHYSSFRSIKKQFRHNKPALIVACIREDEDENLSKQVTQYVREGLANQDTRIVLLHESSFELDEIRWMEELQINGCLLAEESKQSFNLTTLNREIDTFLYIDNNRRQHDAETEMLMCITRFSRDNESLTELLKVFSSTLSKLCCSSCSFHIHMKNIDQATIDYCDNDKEGMVEKLNQLLGLPKIPGYLQHSLDERQPQINLLPDDINLDAIQSQINENIGSYLTFPIIVYEKVLYLLVYFIPENQMNNVSMKQINVINKASEQLTMLLERRQAESSLKKQYKRLQNTLIELKSAKEELQHKEKMASIGQMAAGIAHEINNPLSYVISNFSSMDNYLNSIIQLQDLQSKFLESIESGQDQKINELKKNISRFEEEEDISFILEDIRAVISDSHSGVKRVKNIITDPIVNLRNWKYVIWEK
jgi:phosphoglycerate-specific signal transduction histidine kinase